VLERRLSPMEASAPFREHVDNSFAKLTGSP
jgi:hypothetical protein